MAVIRNTSSARRVGRVGNTTYYVANGQQIARQSRNDSNYGVDASRSRAQQMRRVKWANLVNIYKACRTWMPKAFESKSRTQSDYNKFMSLNINTSSVCLTKDQATQGCAVMASYLVSQGSLPPIVYSGSGTQGSQIITDIEVGSLSLTNAKVKDVSNAIMLNNPQFLNLDNIAVILFKTSEPKANMPYTSTKYLELTLDKDNDTTFASHPLNSFVEIANNKLCVKASLFSTSQYQCIAIIHTRKVGGTLMTSTQQAFPNITDYWDEYSTQDQEERAIASYGVTEDVPLDPSFKLGTIGVVTINGVSRPDVKGHKVTISEVATLVVKGEGLGSDNFYVEQDGVKFTPLSVSDDGMLYVVSSNGLLKIMLNGVLWGMIDIVGIVRPNEIGTAFYLGQLSSTSWSWSDQLREFYRTNVQFINVDFKSTSEANHFVAQLYPSEALDVDNFSIVGGSVEELLKPTESMRYELRIIADPDAPVTYVLYKGFLIIIFNY